MNDNQRQALRSKREQTACTHICGFVCECVCLCAGGLIRAKHKACVCRGGYNESLLLHEPLLKSTVTATSGQEL